MSNDGRPAYVHWLMSANGSTSFVFPGHPLIIAYFIVKKFPSLKAALEPSWEAGFGQRPVAAMASGDIPGGGGSVGAALDMLQSLASGVSFDDACWSANNQWFGIGPADEHTLRRGEEQAETVRPALEEALKTWDLT